MTGAGRSGADKLEDESIGSGKFSNLEVGSSSGSSGDAMVEIECIGSEESVNLGSGSSEDSKRVKLDEERELPPLPLPIYQKIFLQTNDGRNKFRFVSKNLNKMIPPLLKPVTYLSRNGDFRIIEFGVYVVTNDALDQTKVVKLRRCRDNVIGSMEDSPLQYTKECSKYNLACVDLFTGRTLRRVFDDNSLDLENPNITVDHVASHWSANFLDKAEVDDGNNVVPVPFHSRNGSLVTYCPAAVVMHDDGVNIKCIVYEFQRTLVARGLEMQERMMRCFVTLSPGEGLRFESIVLLDGNVYAKEKDSVICYRIETKEFDLRATSSEEMVKLVKKMEIPLAESVVSKWKAIYPNESLVCHLARGYRTLYAIFRMGDAFSS